MKRGIAVVSFLQIFNVFFFYFPAINSYFSGKIGEIASSYGVVSNDYGSIDIMYFTVFILSTSIFLILSRTSKIGLIKHYQGTLTTSLFSGLLVIIWLGLVYEILQQYQNAFWLLLSPARKGLIMSGMTTVLIVVIPQVLLTGSFMFQSSRFKKIVFSLMLLVSGSILGQRREMLVGILLIALLVFFCSHKRQDVMKEFRTMIVVVGVSITLLIPASWYLRVLATQVQRSGVVEHDPLSLRSPIELIFGSLASGYQSYLVVNKYTESDVIRVGDGIRYLSTSMIPRSVLVDKSMTPTQKIKVNNGDAGNISIFFISEVFLNFYYLSIPVLFALLFFINRLNSYFNVHFQYLSVFMFAQSAYVFKNGLLQFVPIFIIYSVLVGVLLLSSRIRARPLSVRVLNRRIK